MKKTINAATYVECSAKDIDSLSEVFGEILDILEPRGDKDKQAKKSKTSQNTNTKCTVL